MIVLFVSENMEVFLFTNLRGKILKDISEIPLFGPCITNTVFRSELSQN